jgi:hypothetical protein
MTTRIDGDAPKRIRKSSRNSSSLSAIYTRFSLRCFPIRMSIWSGYTFSCAFCSTSCRPALAVPRTISRMKSRCNITRCRKPSTGISPYGPASAAQSRGQSPSARPVNMTKRPGSPRSSIVSTSDSGPISSSPTSFSSIRSKGRAGKPRPPAGGHGQYHGEFRPEASQGTYRHRDRSDKNEAIAERSMKPSPNSKKRSSTCFYLPFTPSFVRTRLQKSADLSPVTYVPNLSPFLQPSQRVHSKLRPGLWPNTRPSARALFTATASSLALLCGLRSLRALTF